MATGRFAPSPTGTLHLGNLRTALLAWLFARSAGSPFLMRVEDLDPATARPEHEAAQLAHLAALGIDHDGPVLRQSERRAAHDDAIDQLTRAGAAYPCWCSRREVREAAAAPHAPAGAYPGTCRDLDARGRAERAATGRAPALRLRSGEPEITVVDRLHGELTGVVDDLVLRRADGTPSYHVAVVVDDAFQGVEEVVRGDDLLDSTPRHALLARLLGLPEPAWAHVPLVLGPDGDRLAKRGLAAGLDELVAAGHTPGTVRTLLAASVGLADRDEPVTPAELVERFDPARLPRAPWLLHPDELHPYQSGP